MLQNLELLLLLQLYLQLLELLDICLVLHPFLSGLEVRLMVDADQLVPVLVDVVGLGHTVLDD